MNIIKNKYFIIIALCLFWILPFNLQAQKIGVPIDIQVDLLPKILSLNKSFNLNDSNSVIKVGILFNSSLRSSMTVKNKIIDQVEGSEFKVKNAKAVLVPIDVSKITNIEQYFIENAIKVLYLTPIRGLDITEITKLCRKNQIITFTGVPNFINENDISVGFELENNKLQITINLESAKAEGANFSSRLLNVSQVK